VDCQSSGHIASQSAKTIGLSHNQSINLVGHALDPVNVSQLIAEVETTKMCYGQFPDSETISVQK